jgi:hypothetical protein
MIPRPTPICANKTTSTCLRLYENVAGTTGERRKYLQPSGRPSLAYFPPVLPAALLLDVNIPIIITEGEFKCLALWRLAVHEFDAPQCSAFDCGRLVFPRCCRENDRYLRVIAARKFESRMPPTWNAPSRCSCAAIAVPDACGAPALAKASSGLVRRAQSEAPARGRRNPVD